MRVRSLVVLAMCGCGDPRLPDAARWFVDRMPSGLFAIGGDAVAWTSDHDAPQLTRYAGDTGDERWSVPVPYPRRAVAGLGGIVAASQPVSSDSLTLALVADDGTVSPVAAPEVTGEAWDLADGVLAVATPGAGELAQIAVYDLGATTPRATFATPLPVPVHITVTPSGRVLVLCSDTQGAGLWRPDGSRAWLDDQLFAPSGFATEHGAIVEGYPSFSLIRDDGTKAWTGPGNVGFPAREADPTSLWAFDVHGDRDPADGENQARAYELDLATGLETRELSFFTTLGALAADDQLLLVELDTGGIMGIPR